MFKTTALYSLGYAINRGLFLLYFPLLTSYFSLSDFGLYSLVIVLAQLLLPLQSLNGSAVIMREGVHHYHIAITLYIKYALTTIIITICLFLIWYLFFNSPNNWLLYSFLLSGVEAILLLTLTFFRSQDLPYIYLYLTVFKAILVMAIIYITVHVGMCLEVILYWQFIGILFISISSLIFLIIKNIKLLKWSETKLEKNLFFGILLIPHGISQWILNSSDRFIVKYMENDTSLGIYTIGYTVASVLFFINSGITMAIPQLMIKNYDSWISEKKDTILIKYYSVFSIVLYCFLWSCIYMDKFFFNYLHYYEIDSMLTFIFAYIGIFILGYYYFFANYLFYHKLAKTISTQTIMIAFLNVGLTFILVYFMGLIGASLATLITYGIYFIIVRNVTIKIEHRLIEQVSGINKILIQSLFILCSLSLLGLEII